MALTVVYVLPVARFAGRFRCCCSNPGKDCRADSPNPMHSGLSSGAWRRSYISRGNRGRPGSQGCHEESEARMVKVNVLTLSASPAGLSKLLYMWPDSPILLLLNAGTDCRAASGGGPPFPGETQSPQLRRGPNPYTLNPGYPCKGM